MDSRFEYKYLVPNEYIDEMRNVISVFMDKDPYVSKSNNEYTVRSIYMDSRSFKCYYEKIEGIRQRNKFRIRGYNNENENSAIFLEIKRKDKDYISKDRAPLLYKNLADLFRLQDLENYIITDSDNLSELKSARKFFYHYHKDSLLPAVVIIYEREAYQNKFGHELRITFDKNIRSMIANSFDDLYSENEVKYIFKCKYVLEVKFCSMLPQWLPNMINRFGLQRISVSKYAEAMSRHYDFNTNNRALNLVKR